MSPYEDDPRSPSPANMRRRKGVVRRIERCCAVTFKHFPLAFVYGLSTWAVVVQTRICLVWRVSGWIAYPALILGLLLYGLLNWCYTVAVFTDPGSPSTPVSATSRGTYSHLPTTEPGRDADAVSLTVKSTGGSRFCKKCQARKPDRAHHCSTCGRCVLKMDHHCPWLATCVGLRNYKAFLLFCSYTTLFCWVVGATAAVFVGNGILKEDINASGDLFAVNAVLLAILAGVFGLVLGAFTAWHWHLALKNQTTIECLEKTRYLRPIRRTMDRASQAFPSRSADQDETLIQHYGHQLAEMHANAIPGVTRAEEGEERSSPDISAAPSPPPHPHPHPGQRVPLPTSIPSAASSLRQNLYSSSSSSPTPNPYNPYTRHIPPNTNYADLEAQREHARYQQYLDEQESEKMPHAFDLGARRNLRDLFGASLADWLLPWPSTAGDGWHWEPSARWVLAQEERRRRREASGWSGEDGAQGNGAGAAAHWDRNGAWPYHDMPYDGPGQDQGQGQGQVPYDGPGSGPGTASDFAGVHTPLAARARDAEASSVDGLFPEDEGRGRTRERGSLDDGVADVGDWVVGDEGEGEGEEGEEGEWREWD